MATASASVTARTYCEAASPRVNFGPISMLNVGSGLNFRPISPSPDHEPSGLVS
jgi:hypothetical protein